MGSLLVSDGCGDWDVGVGLMSWMGRLRSSERCLDRVLGVQRFWFEEAVGRRTGGELAVLLVMP